MNGAQLHLALNHIPVVLAIAGLIIMLWGWLSKKTDIKKVGLVLVVVTAVFAGAAYLTGEPAEHVLKKLPDFPRNLVHDHEDAGQIALIFSILAGLLALVSLYFDCRKNKCSNKAFLVTVALILISSATFLWTAHLGGLIRHEEIRPDSSLSQGR